MKHSFFTLLVLVFLGLNISCSKTKSEFQMPNVNGGNNGGSLSEKPKCNFEPVNNCWQESIKILQGLTQGWGTDGYFVQSKEFCSNEFTKLKLQFDRPVDFFDKKIADLLFYPIIGNNEEAFHFAGNSDNFKIDKIVGYPGSRIHFFKDTEGNALVRCMNGEEFKVPAQAFKNGCANHFANTLPGIYMKSDYSKELEFGFLGLPGQTKVFKCALPN